MAISALDGDPGHPAEPVFRRVGPVARDLRPKNGSRLTGITHALIGVRSVVLDYVRTRINSW